MLTIREASERTGHSPHKIRRLIKTVVGQPDHKDRNEIEPNKKDVARLLGEGVQFTWRINEEFVRRDLGDVAEIRRNENLGKSSTTGDSSELLTLLQRITDAKEQAEARLFEQLRIKDEQIAALNDRLRESNVLMASLQKQLPETTKPKPTLIQTAPPSLGKEKGKANKPPKKPRHWLQRLFM